jgi:hypothetical protein
MRVPGTFVLAAAASALLGGATTANAQVGWYRPAYSGYTAAYAPAYSYYAPAAYTYPTSYYYYPGQAYTPSFYGGPAYAQPTFASGGSFYTPGTAYYSPRFSYSASYYSYPQAAYPYSASYLPARYYDPYCP